MAGEQHYTQILQILGLSKTSVISNVGMLRKVDSDSHLQLNSSNIVPRFLSRVNSFDYRAVLIFKHLTLQRQLSKQKSKTIHINCLDALLVILNHCDDFTRQRVLECMAKCNLAVPILLPDIKGSGQGVFQQWALASIIKTIPGHGKFDDVFVSRYPFHVAFFAKFGEVNGFCIADILNKMIGDTQENNIPYSFLGENVDSSPSRLSNGLLGAMWFVPDNMNTSFTDWRLTLPLCFFYLHGNPDHHKKEFEFGYASSSINVIFVAKESFRKFNAKFSELGRHKQVIVAVLSLKSKRKSYTLRGQNTVMVRDFSGTSVADIAKALCTDILLFLKDAPQSNFTLQEAGTSICKFHSVPTDASSDCQKGFELAQKIEKKFSSSKGSYFKTFKLLYHWEIFSKLYKDTQWKRAKVNISQEMELQRQHLRDSRISQFNESLSSPMQFFVNILSESTEMEQLYILSWLKLFLKHRALAKESGYKRNLLPVQHGLDQLKVDNGSRGSVYAKDISSISNEKETFNQLTYGVNTLLQELGQLYECRTYAKNDSPHIANMAANMVLNGHPIDIFDGKTGNVPINWLIGVLKTVQDIIGDQKVFVISILGVQSAGKSTFLNTLFGTNFEVNAGRCTKGVSLQIIKLDKTLSGETGCHFILIIDTEGLQPLQELYKVSNEMATFVLSFSNFAFLNIAGQTIESDIKNILQIAALAFLRMNRVNLTCDCFVVQQLVSDLTALQKNKHDIESLCLTINQAVRHAAKTENIEIERSKEYPEIFKILNFQKGLDRLQYFPPLWGGRNMSTPETSYCELILELRKEVISLIQSSGSKCLKLSVLAERVVDVWKAVKEDDFLFYFQNTEEMNQFNKFKEDYHKICANFLANMGTWKLNHLRKFNPMGQTKAIYKEHGQKLEEELARITDEVYREIDSLLGEEKYWLIKNRAHYFKNDFMERLNDTGESIMHSLQRSSKMLASEFWIGTATKISQAVQSLADKNRITNKDNKDSVEKQFQMFWGRELCNVKSRLLDKMKDKLPQEEVLIEITNRLRDIYRDTLLQKDMKKFMFSFLSIQNLKGIIEESRFLQSPENEIETLSKHAKYLEHFFNFSESPTVANMVQDCVQTFVSALKGKPVIDCSAVSTLFDITKQFQGKIRLEMLATVILKLCLWMAPLILRTIVLSDWEIISYNLENLRGDFYDEYVEACMVVPNRKFQTNLRFSAFIERELVNCLRDELCNTLLKTFTSTIFISKKHLLNNILLDLCEKTTFKEYLMYLKHTKGFIEKWTLNFITKSCVTTKDGNRSRLHVSIEKITQSLIDEKLQIFTDILQKRLQNPTLSYHELFSDLFRDIGRLSDVWYDQSKLESFKLSLSYLSATNFAFEFSNIVNNLKDNLIDALKVPKEPSDFNIVKKWFSNVARTHKELIANLKLCFEVCPFCPVTCDETGRHKVHRSFRHLPKGLGGTWSYPKSPRLVTDDCTALVATDSTYIKCKCSPSRCHHSPSYYKDYRKEHPTWYIHPQGMSEEQPIDYWKWVLKEFNSDFANYYHVIEADIPSAWNNITKSDAIKSLDVDSGHKLKYRVLTFV